MSAVPLFPALARAAAAQRLAAVNRNPAQPCDPHSESCSAADTPRSLPPNLAFYRKHTEALLRRYLYASMLVARAPSVVAEPLMRGWASYRPAETFEDCVIFVLDVERALSRLPRRDRELLTRVVLQEYSIGEAALLLNLPHRIIYRRLADALDRLTGILLTNGTLEVPRGREFLYEDELDE